MEIMFTWNNQTLLKIINYMRIFEKKLKIEIIAIYFFIIIYDFV